tara:strand:+ start:2929 stop:3564 length:636 start_codon:yes stop_codon:yes gene_type:complete
MSSRPDAPVINDNDHKVKKAVEKSKNTIEQVLTQEGKTALSNNKEEIKEKCKSWYEKYIKKDTDGKRQMIEAEKEKLQSGVKLGIFNQVELNEFLEAQEPLPDQHGGYPGPPPYREDVPITDVLISFVVVATFGAFLWFTPGALNSLVDDMLAPEAGAAAAGHGGSKHKKRKGRKSKKTKKSMKHKKGRKSKKAKKSMKKKKGRKSMKKRK